MKKLFCILAAALLILCCACASAGTSVEGGVTGISGSSDLSNIAPFEFKVYKNGIGYGSCPVYTAPSMDAYRCANGKASVSTDDSIAVAGYVNGWLLVRYETNNGGVRVGYIPPKYIKGFTTPMTLHLEYIPQTAGATIRVTDNPMLAGTAFATLDPGETYYILGKYTYYGNWWYIECTVDGQVARGFISRDADGVDAGDEDPSLSPLGTSCIGTVKVTKDSWRVRKDAGQDYSAVATIYYGETYPVYGSKRGSNGNTWYYLYIDGIWGWASSGGLYFSAN